MKRNTLSILAGIMTILLFALACNLSIPGSNTIDSAATSVAGTVNALARTAEGVLTALPHDAAVTEAPTEALPTLPPDAEAYPLQVSFVTPDGNLYLWTEGMGTPQLLASDGNILDSFVSPDGTMIAFTRFIGSEFVSLELINADGTGRRLLLDSAGADALPKPEGSMRTQPNQIAWVPDSHKLSLNVIHFFEGPGLFRGENFYQIDADSGAFNTLLNTGSTTWQFVWSRDGSQVAISDPDGIDIYNAAGVKTAGPILTYPFVNTASEYAWTAYPIWSSDSTTLIARVPPQDPFFSTGLEANSSMWRIAADGMSGEQIYSGLMRYQMHGDTGVSPDLTRMLYYVQTGVPADNIHNLIVSNVDGSSSSIYATGQVQSDPVWSPDSEHFFYSIGWLPDSHPYIGQVGAAPVAVPDFLNAINAKWIDANRYLAVTNDDGRWRLLLGTMGAPTGLIYDSVSAYGNEITFSVNR